MCPRKKGIIQCIYSICIGESIFSRFFLLAESVFTHTILYTLCITHIDISTHTHYKLYVRIHKANFLNKKSRLSNSKEIKKKSWYPSSRFGSLFNFFQILLLYSNFSFSLLLIICNKMCYEYNSKAKEKKQIKNLFLFSLIRKDSIAKRFTILLLVWRYFLYRRYFLLKKKHFRRCHARNLTKVNIKNLKSS